MLYTGELKYLSFPTTHRLHWLWLIISMAIANNSWSRSGRKLLSSSTDWNVLLWDIASGEIDLKFRFPSPVLRAQFHPRNK